MLDHTLAKVNHELEDRTDRDSWGPEGCAARGKASLVAAGAEILVLALCHENSHCYTLLYLVEACLCLMLAHSSGLRRGPGMTLGVERDENSRQGRLDHNKLKVARLDIWARARTYVLGCKKLDKYFQYSHSGLEKECGNQDACVSRGTQKGNAEAGIVHLLDFLDLLQTWLASARGHGGTESRNTSDHPEHTEVHKAMT